MATAIGWSAHSTHGAFDSEPARGAYSASVGAGQATAPIRLSLGQNPSAQQPWTMGLALHHYRPYGLEELRVVEAGLHHDFSRAGWAMYYGEMRLAELYLERNLELQHGYLFPGGLRLGGAVSWRRLDIVGYPEVWLLGEAIGFTWAPLPRLRLGALLRDAISSRRWPLALDASAGAGALFLMPGGHALHYDMQWNPLQGVSHRVAQTLKLHRWVEFAAGMSDNPYRFALGIRVGWGTLRLFQAFAFHDALGRSGHSGIEFMAPSPFRPMPSGPTRRLDLPGVHEPQ